MASITALVILGLLWGGVYLLMAEGLNLIYGVMKVVNLAHGDLIVFGGLLAYTLFAHAGLTPITALLPVALALFALGAVIQWGVLERIPLGGAAGELRTLLATFGLSYVVSNTSFLLWGGQFQSIPFLQGALRLGPLAIPEGLLACSLAAFVAALIVHFWLHRTMAGKALRATAESPLGAASCGLEIGRIRIIAFALGAAMAGAAGALVIALVPFQIASGGDLTVQSFTLIALGGLGNYLGAWIAAEILGLTEVMSQYYLGPDIASAVIYLLFIAVLLFRPQGLLGRVGRI